jgi:hypothetical protein
MNLTWFYLHIVIATVILYKDYNGTLEDSLDRFEQSIGLYTPPDTIDSTPPYYMPPTEQDSTWILPRIEGIDDIPKDSSMSYANILSKTT